MSILDWEMVCVFVFFLGFGVGWILRKKKDNYLWKNISPFMLEQIAAYRKRKWVEERRDDIEPDCGL